MLNITNHQGNANQNHNKISLHLSEWLPSKKRNKCWLEYWEKGTLVHGWWECKLVQPPWKTVWSFLKKSKIELLYNPAIPLLGTHLKETKSLSRRYICTPMFNAALLTIAEIRKQPKCPLIDEWIKKMWHSLTHTHTRAYTYYGLLIIQRRKSCRLWRHGWT